MEVVEAAQHLVVWRVLWQAGAADHLREMDCFVCSSLLLPTSNAAERTQGTIVRRVANADLLYRQSHGMGSKEKA